MMMKNRQVRQSKEYGERKYGLISNVIYNMRSSKIWDRKLFYFQLLMIFPDVASAYLGVLLPAQLVRGLKEKWDMAALLLTIFLLALGIWICEMLREGMQEYLYRNSLSFHLYYEKRCFEKVMAMDYELLEEPENRRLAENTWNVVRNEFGIRNSFLVVPMLLSGGPGTVLYGIMIGRESPLILLALILNTGVSWLLMSFVQKKHQKAHERLGVFTSRAAYVSRQSMERTAGKEIRIYGMKDWFMQKYEECLKGIDGIYGYIHNWYFLRGSAEALLTLLSEGFAYGLLLLRLAQGKTDIPDFVFFLGLLGGFGSYFGQTLRSVLSLNQVDTSIGYIRRFLDQPESVWKEEGIGEEKIAAMKAAGVKVELAGVSYTYPNAQEAVLSDISLVIRPGERLALIGLNGAGKTTLVKLLCGFYQPTRGEIRINNIPASEFTRQEYYSLVSVLFQDSFFLPMSLDLNLTGCPGEAADTDRLTRALSLSGFLEKYESLPEKGDTLLVREANEKAVDFSGGERQKLLFARALYKKAPLVILDEPTAALDPIAENEMYLKFGQAVEGRTCVYISHRLSSTRFCDRICLLEGGRIIEEGTHDDLMERKGRYARIYEIQSQYYRQRDERKRAGGAMGDAPLRQEEREELFYEQRGH